MESGQDRVPDRGGAHTFFRSRRLLLLVAVLGCGVGWVAARSVDDRSRPGLTFPTTVSGEAKRLLPEIYSTPRRSNLSLPAVKELDAADRLRARLPEGSVQTDGAAQGTTATRVRVRGVPALDIRPASSGDARKALVFFHGGAFVIGSAQGSLPLTLRLAEATNVRTLSPDYTTAPHAKWPEVTRQALALVNALLADGYQPSDIALAGESAGGNLAVVTALALRDKGRGQAAAVLAWSPWVDLSGAGDTRSTLREAELLFLAERVLAPAAALYADPGELRHPYVSPVYADYKPGFPALLIQAGTREVLLSDAVRLHRAVADAGGSSQLDLYEGMPHVFHMHLSLPESGAAIGRSAQFLRKHLGLTSRP